MKSLALAALLLAAPPLLAATVQIGPSASLLIRDSVATETTHNGTTYVQVALGDEYEVRLINPYDRRIAVQLTVDGLNTIDGRENDGRLWVLGPRETATIPGWQVSGSTARKFSVSREQDSYARQRGAKTKLGIVRAAFYEERLRLYEVSALPIGTPASSVTFTSSAASLGTAMGAPTAHDVNEVAFDRGAEIGAVELRYVTAAELQAVLRWRQSATPTPWCPEPERQALRGVR